MAMRVYWVGTAILFWSLVYSPSLEADIFKWVDDQGAVHYTDLPSKSKDYEWINDSETIHFSFKPGKNLENKNKQALPARKIRSKIITQQKKVRKNYSPSNGGGNYQPSTRPTATRGNYQRQTRSGRGSATRSSGRGRSSSGRY
jgi:hypothetical protein